MIIINEQLRVKLCQLTKILYITKNYIGIYQI